MFDDLNTNGIETERGVLGRAAWAALRITLLVLSGLTTAAFFLAYAGAMSTRRRLRLTAVTWGG